MERSQKENLVGELQGFFNSGTVAVLIDYRGLAANELVEMRQELHKVCLLYTSPSPRDS